MEYNGQRRQEKLLKNVRQSLSRLKENDPTLQCVQIGEPDGRNGFIIYFPTLMDAALGELGGCIANNTRVVTISFRRLAHLEVNDIARPLFDGLKNNVSIRRLEWAGCDFSRRATGAGREMLNVFKENNANIRCISLTHCYLGNGGVDAIASTLRRLTHLQELTLNWCQIDDELLTGIVSAVMELPRVSTLDLGYNRIGTAGCQALSSLLQDPNCNVRILILKSNLVDDIGAASIAHALTGNQKLRELSFDNDGTGEELTVFPNPNLNNNNSITNTGWKSFARALCNTTNINATHLSNHTLEKFGEHLVPNLHLQLHKSLVLNKSSDVKGRVAIRKILQYHRNFDLEPLFEWDLKVLPHLAVWFDRAWACVDYSKAISVNKRKLTSIYQFIRALPDFLELASGKRGPKRMIQGC